MPIVTMPDGTNVEMPDKLDPQTAERLKAFQATTARGQSYNLATQPRKYAVDPVEGGKVQQPLTRPDRSLGHEMAATLGAEGDVALAIPQMAVAGAQYVAKHGANTIDDAATDLGRAFHATVQKGKEEVSHAIRQPGQALGDLTDVINDPVKRTQLTMGGVGAAQGLRRTVAAGVDKVNSLKEAATAARKVAEEAPAKAQAYAESHGIDWNRVGPEFKSHLTEIAKHAGSLEGLDPEAVKAEALLKELNVPATRGQITRNMQQLTAEENISKTEAGKPLQDISANQDIALHENLDKLTQGTGAKSATRQQVGASVQGALRSSLRTSQRAYKKAYELANSLGENELVTTEKLDQFLKDPINDANVGTDIRSRLKAYASEDGKISLKHLEDIRQELTRNAKNPNKGGHYAGEATKVIDEIMDESGSSAYKNARAAFKASKDEFDKQGRIKKLVTEKGYSSDRATALENTLDHVIKSPTEDIGKIKKSLFKAGPAGRQAWADIQGGVIQHLREAASGAQGPTAVPRTGTKRQMQFNSRFIDEFNKLEADGKIDALFSPQQAAELRKIAKATELVRTKPNARIAGSPTSANMMNMLESGLDKVVGMIPYGGKPLVAAKNLYKETQGKKKFVKEAVKSPLSDKKNYILKDDEK